MKLYTQQELDKQTNTELLAITNTCVDKCEGIKQEMQKLLLELEKYENQYAMALLTLDGRMNGKPEEETN